MENRKTTCTWTNTDTLGSSASTQASVHSTKKVGETQVLPQGECPHININKYLLNRNVHKHEQSFHWLHKSSPRYPDSTSFGTCEYSTAALKLQKSHFSEQMHPYFYGKGNDSVIAIFYSRQSLTVARHDIKDEINLRLSGCDCSLNIRTF